MPETIDLFTPARTPYLDTDMFGIGYGAAPTPTYRGTLATRPVLDFIVNRNLTVKGNTFLEGNLTVGGTINFLPDPGLDTVYKSEYCSDIHLNPTFTRPQDANEAAQLSMKGMLKHKNTMLVIAILIVISITMFVVI